MMSTFSSSAIHCDVVSSSGSPARYSAFSEDRSYLRISSTGCLRSTRMAVGAENMRVTWYFSTMLHQIPASGQTGKPSYRMVAMPAISGPYTM
ncbi:hypothetical protein D3C72_1613940 [compost metagenome]